MQKAYRSLNYANCFKESGDVYRLPQTDSYLIQKPYKDGFSDLCSVYPFYDPPKKHQFYHIDLIADINSITDPNILSVTIVTNPLMKWAEMPVGKDNWCWSYCKEFKTHYYIDYREKLDLPSNHKRNIKKSLNSLDIKIDMISSNEKKAQSFIGFYKNLVKRHDIVGFADFPDSYFLSLFNVPGIMLLEAYPKGSREPCGQITYLLDGEYAYYHLAAYNEEGYANNASFGMMHSAIEYFRSLGVNKLLLGGSAGMIEDENDGLARFKKGFSNKSIKNHILGKVLNESKYNEFSKGINKEYFPLYRGA